MQQLPEIMHQPNNLHPLGLAIFANGFSGLKQVFNLWEVNLAVAEVMRTVLVITAGKPVAA